jgi:hypothetical protein
LKDRVAGKPIAKRIVAAYAVGWPVSIDTDLPEMGLPACTSPDQTGCILGWQSFAEPAEYERILKVYDGTTGFNGQSRANTAMLCTNPLTGVLRLKPRRGQSGDTKTIRRHEDRRVDQSCSTRPLRPARLPADRRSA